MQWAKNKHGFTIVELLIVVVVIAILASITIVAYTGIRDRAQQSAAAASLQSVNKKIALYKIENGDQLPTAMGDIGLSSSVEDSTVYWPMGANEYCISSDEGGTSYYTRSDTPRVTNEGKCDEINWIAGAPIGYNETTGTSTPLTKTLEGQVDITLYSVHFTENADSFYGGTGGLAPSVENNRFYFQMANSGDVGAGYRIDTPNHLNYTGYQPNVRDSARYHISWLQSSSNGTVRSFAYDKPQAHHSSSINIGTGWTFTSIFLGSVQPSIQPIAIVAYDEAHNESQRRDIMNWLAQKYSTGQTF